MEIQQENAGLSSSAAPRIGNNVRECSASGLSVLGKTREISRRWKKLPDIPAFSRRWTGRIASVVSGNADRRMFCEYHRAILVEAKR